MPLEQPRSGSHPIGLRMPWAGSPLPVPGRPLPPPVPAESRLSDPKKSHSELRLEQLRKYLDSERDGEVDAAVIKQLLNSIDPTGNNSNPKNIRKV